jgi:hypothetical protein
MGERRTGRRTLAAEETAAVEVSSGVSSTETSSTGACVSRRDGQSSAHVPPAESGGGCLEEGCASPSQWRNAPLCSSFRFCVSFRSLVPPCPWLPCLLLLLLAAGWLGRRGRETDGKIQTRRWSRKNKILAEKLEGKIENTLLFPLVVLAS